MSSTWVVNASPVIVLAKIGQLHLLGALANPLLLPGAVAKELLAGPADDPARAAAAGGWGQQCSPKQVPEEIIEWGLRTGESAVLALCLEHEFATAVLDDASARVPVSVENVRASRTLIPDRYRVAITPRACSELVRLANAQRFRQTYQRA